MDTKNRIGRQAGRPRLRTMALRLALGTALPALASLMILLTLFGRSPHLGHVGPTIAFTLLSALALVGAGFAAALALSLPEVSLKATVVWLPAAIILAVGVAAELAFLPRQQWFVRMAGGSPFACFASVLVLSLPLLAGALWALRRGAPADPRAAGAVAGLLAGGVTAALYLLHCPEDSLLFILAWHVPALVLVAALGTTLGDRVLRR